MGVQLNIKDAETVRLARDLADQSGRSVTETIRHALAEEMQRRNEDIERRVDEVMALLAGGRQHLKPEWRDKSLEEIMNSIYDEDGLPI